MLNNRSGCSWLLVRGKLFGNQSLAQEATTTSFLISLFSFSGAKKVTMPSKKIMLGTLALAILFAAGHVQAAEPKTDFTGVLNAIKVPSKIKLGKCSGVGVDAQGRIFVLQRSNPPILSFDKSGKFLRGFGKDYIAAGHGLKVDAAGNVWATCTEHHMVYKFDRQGKLLLALGQIDKPGTGTDPPQFDKPTDAAVGPDGSIYIADGYGNSRMVKFTAEGKFVSTWGKAGDAPGEFAAPHQVIVDAKGRVIVGDRDNGRVQVFDGDGKLLHIWPVTKPFGVALDPKGVLFISTGKSIQQLDESGTPVATWGKQGDGPLEFKTGHQIAIDNKGNVYVAEVSGQRMQKLQRNR